MKAALYIAIPPICGALLFYFGLAAIHLAEYTGDVIAHGFAVANLAAQDKKIYGFASNMSSLLAIGFFYGLMLSFFSIAFRWFNGRWPDE